MDVKEKLAERIKSLREDAGLTQRSLSEATGISLSAIIAYENKQREPNSKNMAILERFFGVSGAYLRGADTNNTASWQHLSALNGNNVYLMPLKSIMEHTQTDTISNQKQVFQILSDLEDVLALEDEPLRTLLLNVMAQSIQVLKHNLERFND